MDRMEMVALRPVMDSPPAKRTRRRAPSTTSDARSSSRRDTRSEIRPVWHPDGDLVLEVEGCLFKIHCHRLSCSEVFADMFALPQPPDAERIEDSPLVRLQDNARDWIVALGWVYDPEYVKGPDSGVCSP